MSLGVVEQELRILPDTYEVRFLPQGAETEALNSPWTALVRGPEGLTVIAPADPAGDAATESWKALYNDNAHALDMPGMLASIVGPLANKSVPVFVSSTFHADLVLVPAARLSDAIAALHAAGHTVLPG